MNKENASQYLPFVIALSEGKTIQRVNGVNVFEDTSGDILFTYPPDNYRIKPDLMEFYAVTNKAKTDILSGVYKTEKEATDYINDSGFDSYKTVVLLREVTK